MASCTADSGPRVGGRSSGESARERAVWLAELATWRRGLIRLLVARYGGLDQALRLDWRTLAAAVRRTPRRRADSQGEGCGSSAGGLMERDGRATAPAHAPRRSEAPGSPDEQERDASLFATLLARGPRAGSAAGSTVVTWLDAAYPPQLRELPDPPPALFLAGQIAGGLQALAAAHVVGVVGSRGPSSYGREMARAVARDLAARGVVVVSGLALGIDAVAHEAALEATAGATRLATVAVLGCGADVEHPPGNRRLFALVRERGLIVSEVSWGVGARPWRFPARNRLMAALCEAVVVVEGSERSGALITARHALDLGREVLAVPGEAGRRLSAGPHRLLRQGAAVCESAADVLEIIGCGGLAIGWKGRALQVGATAGPNAQTGSGAAGGRDDIGVGTARDTAHDAAAGPVQRLVRALDDGAQTVDGLAAGAGLGTASALALLAELEVEGVVEACGGGAYRLRRDA